MNIKFLGAVLTVSFLVLAAPLHAALPGDEHWDYRFSLPGVDNAVFTLLSTNGRIHCGGLSYFDGSTNTQVDIWNGTNWTSLPKLNGGIAVIYDLAWYKNELYAAGIFTRASGMTNIGLARWDGFGWRNVGGFQGIASKLRVYGDDLYVGGSFTNAGPVQANSVARWDGAGWHALGSGVEPYNGGNFTVQALAMLGSDLYVGGTFSTAGGAPATNFARWNGSAIRSPGATRMLPSAFQRLIGTGAHT